VDGKRVRPRLRRGLLDNHKFFRKPEVRARSWAPNGVGGHAASMDFINDRFGLHHIGRDVSCQSNRSSIARNGLGPEDGN